MVEPIFEILVEAKGLIDDLVVDVPMEKMTLVDNMTNQENVETEAEACEWISKHQTLNHIIKALLLYKSHARIICHVVSTCSQSIPNMREPTGKYLCHLVYDYQISGQSQALFIMGDFKHTVSYGSQECQISSTVCKDELELDIPSYKDSLWLSVTKPTSENETHTLMFHTLV